MLSITMLPYPWVSTSSWMSSSDFNSTLQIVGSWIAIIAGIVCISRFSALQERIFLIVGLGFFIVGTEDFIQGLFSFQRIVPNLQLELNKFIAATHITGRSILAIMIVLSGWTEKPLGKSKNPKKEAAILSFISFSFAGILTAIFYRLPLLRLVYPGHLIAHPLDLLSASLFLVGMVLYTRKYMASGYNFFWWIVTACIFNFIGELYVAQSQRLYDSFFDIAHIFYVFGYMVPIIGISLESGALFKQQRKYIHDLSDANRRLKKLDDLKSEFISAASHALKTPLTSIKGYVSLILDSKAGDINETQRKFLGYVKESTERLNRLVSNLLNLSRVEPTQVRMNIKRVRTHLEEIVRKEISVFRSAAQEKNIGITFELTNRLPEVYCDPDRICEVVDNLLSNAIKYTPSGGKIRVATGKKQSYLYVAVQDTGTGIKKQDLERIFEPFQRIEKPTGVESHPLERKEEEGHEGTGLGLTIVKRIVEAHGGHVEVESKINQGSKFSFFLPLRKR